MLYRHALEEENRVEVRDQSPAAKDHEQGPLTEPQQSEYSTPN